MQSRWHTGLLVLLAVASATGGTLLALRQPAKPDPIAQWQGDATRNTFTFGGGAASELAQFREAHKFTFQLQRVAFALPRLERSPDPLTPAQARAILALLAPLRTQPTLSQDSAKDTMLAIQRTLTIEQRTALAQGGGGGRRSGRRTGNRGGGATGARSGGQAQPAFDPKAMKNFNPFAQPASDTAGANSQSETLFTSLEAIASTP